MNILITDDEAILRVSLADALERVSPGNEIDFAEDYDTAISRIRETHYDIAFCDIQMPGKNGLDLTGSNKRMSPRTNIIIVTAYSEYALDAFKLFVSGYILKPVKDADLAAALDNLRIAPAPPPEKKLDIRCFGNFEVFIDGKPMYFHRKRSKEILAYLVCLRGASAGRDEICGNVFEYQEATDKMIANFKIIVHTLKKDLEKHGVGEFLIHSQNRYSIDTDLVTCDYFDYLTGRSTAQNTYHGEFMTQYSWAEQFIYMLDSIRGEGYGE